jgi:hypothetical protein
LGRVRGKRMREDFEWRIGEREKMKNFLPLLECFYGK